MSAGDFLQRLARRFCGHPAAADVNPVQPAQTGVITATQLGIIVRAACPGTEFYVSDSSFALCPAVVFRDWLAWDRTNNSVYVPNDYDCDDFAFRLMGQVSYGPWAAFAVGIVWTDRHAFNCFVDSDRQLWFLEPQTDQLMTKIEPWMGEKFRWVTI